MSIHIPRITIGAWTQTESVSSALRSAYDSRHMIRAKSTELNEGSPEDALNYYVDRASPDLLIVEINHDEAGTREYLDRLADRTADRTKVVLIGRINDVRFYKEMIDLGISEYVLAPVDGTRLVELIGKIYKSHQFDNSGRLSLFIGACGGVGATTVALNTAYAAAEKLDAPTLLVDMDVGFGSVQLNLNSAEGGQDIGQALFNDRSIDEGFIAQLIQRVTNRLDVVMSPSTLDRNLDLSQETVDRVMDALRNTAPHTIIDMPRSWSQWVRSTMALANDIVIVTQPDMVGLRNTKAMFQTLQTMRRDTTHPQYIINMAGRSKREEIKSNHFLEAIGVAPLAVIADDPKTFSVAANEGKPVVQRDGGSQIANQFMEIAAALQGNGRAGMSSKVQTKPKTALGLGSGLSGLLGKMKKPSSASAH
jgi:pilus assembly protein CpaE